MISWQPNESGELLGFRTLHTLLQSPGTPLQLHQSYIDHRFSFAASHCSAPHNPPSMLTELIATKSCASHCKSTRSASPSGMAHGRPLISFLQITHDIQKYPGFRMRCLCPMKSRLTEGGSFMDSNFGSKLFSSRLIIVLQLCWEIIKTNFSSS